MSLFSDSGDERTQALRQRTRSSDGYARVSSDDELDMLPTLSNYRNAKTLPKKQSAACKSLFLQNIVILHYFYLISFRCFVLLCLFRVRNNILVHYRKHAVPQLALFEDKCRRSWKQTQSSERGLRGNNNVCSVFGGFQLFSFYHIAHHSCGGESQAR